MAVAATGTARWRGAGRGAGVVGLVRHLRRRGLGSSTARRLIDIAWMTHASLGGRVLRVHGRIAHPAIVHRLGRAPAATAAAAVGRRGRGWVGGLRGEL